MMNTRLVASFARLTGATAAARSVAVLAVLTILAACSAGPAPTADDPVAGTEQSMSAERNAVNAGCGTNTTGPLSCPMIPGQTTYTREVNLVNTSGVPYEVIMVNAWRADTTGYTEYCANLWYPGDPNLHPPGQVVPGHGEVGCVQAWPGQQFDNSMRWNGYTSTLLVPPGASFSVGGWTVRYEGMQFTVLAAAQAGNAASWRQPQRDFQRACNGGEQYSPWEPWRNNLGRAAYVNTVQIYSEAGLDNGCLYAYASDGRTLQWQHCGLTVPGGIYAVHKYVEAGGYLVGQGNAHCASGGTWDWVAYSAVE
jgi:hypothetical protein